MITAFYAGLLGLWLMVLYMRVVHYRRKFQVGLGDGGRKELLQAIRIHGNFIETVPYVLILMMLLEMTSLHHGLLHAFGGALIATRALHYIALQRSSGESRARVIAGILTLALIGAGSGFLLYTAVLSGAVFSF